MRKSILGIFAAVLVLALLLGEKFSLSRQEEEGLYYAKTTANNSYQQRPSEKVVPSAVFPDEGETIVIEEEEVPLAATIPVEGEEVPLAATIVIEEEEVPLAATIPETVEKEEVPVTVKAEASHALTGVAKAEEQATSRYSDLGGGVYGYYDEEAANKLLAQVNMMRMGVQGASALKAELNDIAQRRALACVNDFSHNGMETSAECMAIGQQDAAGVVTAWCASDEHRTYISETAYSQAGAACICYEKKDGQMQTLWVLVLN